MNEGISKPRSRSHYSVPPDCRDPGFDPHGTFQPFKSLAQLIPNDCWFELYNRADIDTEVQISYRRVAIMILQNRRLPRIFQDYYDRNAQGIEKAIRNIRTEFSSVSA